MKSEIELVRFGDVVEMTFTYTIYNAEPDVGYMDDYFEFEVESYLTFDEEGIALSTVDANDLEVTDYIHSQLSDAANDDIESGSDRVTRACDIKESLMSPFFESLGQDFKNLTIRKDI